ncbi:multidrug resistance-associated protein 5 [Tanacetum coccineum]
MLKEQQRFWHVIPDGGNLFNVRSGSEGFTVDEGKRTCSCRMWQLSGIPCVHATKSMYSTILPPKPRKMPGRPRNKRIRYVGEGGSSTRVSKVGGKANYSNCKKPKHNKASCTEPIVKQTPKPKGVVGRHRNKQSVDDLKDVDVVQRVPVRDEGAGGSRGGGRGSRGGSSISRRVDGGSRGGSSVSGSASGSTGRAAGGPSGGSGSRGRGASGSGSASGSRGRGAGGSKRKLVSSARTQKRQGKKKVGTSEFPKWFGLPDEDQVQTQDEPVQTQDEDQVEQT